ncbi:uncharacterized protein BJ171DRAFT_496529 [Polychytrium aggregatum]|uniref:uncharacterized protein n=1 Tax=Polychytrium aggregatum TaxID=110093 RepID=UPI0022FE3037|nr:uncharacterized protein BJ171DRAFT_496529 [Polychytrium aggregatum]KAI9206654.1 hypothetical protein BJ171DRAFT_496529 [Polychytrium aggregatum]
MGVVGLSSLVNNTVTGTPVIWDKSARGQSPALTTKAAESDCAQPAGRASRQGADARASAKSCSERLDPMLSHWIVDGNSFLHYICASLNWIQGANYHGLEEQIQVFAATIQEFGILPLFVFDGPLPAWKALERDSRDGQKLQRILAALNTLSGVGRIDYTKLVTAASNHIANVLPPMALQCCVCALKSANIDVFFAEGEADPAIAALARQRNAVVVSRDSDYYIYEGLKAYIPLSTLQMPPPTQGADRSIRATYFQTTQVAAALAIPTPLLPLFAALVGCDYIDAEEYELVGKITAQLGSKSPAVRIKIAQKLLGAYGPGQEVNDAIDQLVASSDSLSDSEKSQLRDILLFAVNTYRGIDGASPDVSGVGAQASASKVTTGLPSWEIASARMKSGDFSHKLFEVVMQRAFWCTPVLEDLNRASVWELGRPIRQAIYSLLALTAAKVRADEQCALDSQSPPCADLCLSEYIGRKIVVAEKIRRNRQIVTENVPPLQVDELTTMLEDVRISLPTLNPGAGAVPPAIRTGQWIMDQSRPKRRALYEQIVGNSRRALLNSSLAAKFVPAVCAIRLLIVENHARGQPLLNTEVVSLAVSALIAASGVGIAPLQQPNESTISRGSIHLGAQLEIALFNAMLLAQALFLDDDSFLSSHWRSLNGPLLFACLQSARRGCDLSKLLCQHTTLQPAGAELEGLMKQLRQLYLLVRSGIEERIDVVIEFDGLDADPTPSKSPRSSRPQSSATSKSKRAKTSASRAQRPQAAEQQQQQQQQQQSQQAADSNIFSLLSSGCSF